MYKMPRFMEGPQAEWEEIRTKLGAYGADTKKDVILKGNVPWLRALEKNLSPADVKRIQKAKKKNCTYHSKMVGTKLKIYGNKKNMKRTQRYPWGYAAKLGVEFQQDEPHMQRRLEHMDLDSSSESDYPLTVGDKWEDCEFDYFEQVMISQWSQEGLGCPI